MVLARVATFLVVALVAFGCARSETERKEAPRESPTARAASPDPAPRSGVVTVVEGQRPARATYASQDQVYGLEATGAERLPPGVNATLVGNLSPAVVVGHGRESGLIYHAFERNRPVLRVHNPSTDANGLLEVGAYSVAWRNDGALGYFKGLKPDVADDPRQHAGHVFVRTALDRTPIRWTATPAPYIVAAWAGRHLLVYRLTRLSADVLVLDGPGRHRVLAQNAVLAAVSPDGGRALIADRTAAGPRVRLISVGDGRQVATLRVAAPPGAGGRVDWVGESGSWMGQIVVAPVNHGVVVFRVAGQRITLEQVLRFDSDRFPVGVSEPQFAESERTIVAWGQLGLTPAAVAPAVVLECDRLTLRCLHGPQEPGHPGPRLVYNPSRP